MKEVTINYLDVELIVVGNYEEGEEPIYYDGNMEGHPGSDPTFEALEVYAKDSEINIIDLLHEHIAQIEEMCLEEI